MAAEDSNSPPGCSRSWLVIVIGLIGLCIIAYLGGWNHAIHAWLGRPVPVFPPVAPFTPWPTPPVATAFDFPLQPAEDYGPYIQDVTGPLAVDTRYGAQNPAQGDRANCFRTVSGNAVPFSQLYHAGVDLFMLDDAGGVAWGRAARAPVYAVADGVVVFVVDANSEGYVIGIQHILPDGGAVYSVYWHVSYVQVQEGQPVARGQAIAVVHNMGLNSHLHWEMRTFYDGTAIFPAGTAGARGACNRQIMGVGYTWDDDPSRARPDYYGYLDPIAFVESH